MLFAPYLLALATALAIRDESQPLKFSLNKNTRPEVVEPDRTTRAGPAGQRAQLWVDGYYYMIDVELGTKGQKFSVEIDTGSADLWINKPEIHDLSLWKNLSEPFSIGYYDQTSLHGWFGTSLLWLDNGLEVKDYQWVVADNLSKNPNGFAGIFGVGRVENELTNKKYPNFVQRLKDDGQIKTNGYLYYLNAKDATSGDIVFGGIDKAKINGTVATIPLNTGTPDSRFDNIQLTKITGSDGEVLGENIEVNLDTGYTITKLPKAIVAQIQKKVPNTVRKDGLIFVPCNIPSDLYYLLWFNDVEVRFSLNDLAIRARDDKGTLTGSCILGVQPTPEGTPNTLGVSSLTHMYVTVDHDKNVALISNVHHTDEENIVLL